MNTIPVESPKQEIYILKSNLWKFFKTLRAQANLIYSLLIASSIQHAWITILDTMDTTRQKRIPISQFIYFLKKMPSQHKHYQLSICLWSLTDNTTQDKYIHEIAFLHELSINNIKPLLSNMIAYHYVVALKQGYRLEMSQQFLQSYKIKARYQQELQDIIQICENTIDFTSQVQSSTRLP